MDMTDEAIRPEEWLAYRHRRSFNLIELACLLSGVSLERMSGAVVGEHAKQARAQGREPRAGEAADLIEAAPELMLGDRVGGTLKRLKTAAAARTMLQSVTIVEAQQLADTFGLEWPAELALAKPLTPPRAKAVPAARAHEQNIRQALTAAGFDPAKLPLVDPGRTCPAKAAAREACTTMSEKTFDKAWERMSRSGEVRRA